MNSIPGSPSTRLKLWESLSEGEKKKAPPARLAGIVLKKWTVRIRDWNKILAQLSIDFEERPREYL